MQKEDWINSVLNSSADIKPAEPNAYLYHKLITRLGESNTPRIQSSFMTKWAIAIVMILLINITGIMAYTSFSKQKNETAAVKALSYELISSTAYSY